MLKAGLKGCAQGVALLLVWPAAALAGFGRVRAVYQFFAQYFALIPGLPGSYLRVAYYALTLRRCSLQSRVGFGSYMAHPASEIGRDVFVGSYCVLGLCRLGERCQIASQVQILSGRRHHGRDAGGRLLPAAASTFERVEIGADCWIGAAAVVMANVGAGTTVGAGAVVVRDLPPGVVAVGNPARVRESG